MVNYLSRGLKGRLVMQLLRKEVPVFMERVSEGRQVSGFQKVGGFQAFRR